MASSGVDPPLILICESLELLSTPFSSGVDAAPAVLDFDATGFVLLDCCLSLAEGILFFVRSVGLGPDGTSGRLIISEPRGLLLAGEVELCEATREEAPAVLGTVVLLDAGVVVLLVGAVRGVGGFLDAAVAPVVDAVAGFVEARVVDVVDVTVDLDVVVGLVVFGTVVFGETGVLLLDPLAGDAVRVSVLLADTLDVAVFLGSSTFDFKTVDFEAIGLDVREDEGFAAAVAAETPVGFGFAAGVLAARGCLAGVVVVVLGVGVLAAGFDAAPDRAAVVELTGVLLDAAVPDVGLLLANVDPVVDCFEAVEDATLDTGVELGFVAVGLVVGFGDGAALFATLVVVAGLEGDGLTPRLGDGDAADLPSSFLSPDFFVSFSSVGCATVGVSIIFSGSLETSSDGTLTSTSTGLSTISF